ncbi:hypothetical protein [Azospirillum himalayense]|uniref:Uncharacterized protein n=1 Tax=Azospirillum himalayense TaxID=654847 RepID=A0ABW0GBK2_9PROT
MNLVTAIHAPITSMMSYIGDLWRKRSSGAVSCDLREGAALLKNTSVAVSQAYVANDVAGELPAIVKASELEVDVEDKYASDTSAYHVSDILDGIGDYMLWIKRLKDVHPDAYSLFSRVGGTIIPHTDTVRMSTVLDHRVPKDPRQWPSFFMFSFQNKADDNSSIIVPKLIYFRKIHITDSNRDGVVSAGLSTYQGVLFFTKKGEKFRFPVAFYVGVLPDGTVIPLRQATSSKQLVRHRHKRRGDSSSTMITHRSVGYPSPLIELFRDRKKNESETIEDYVSSLFFLSMSAAVAAFDGVQINVKKDNVVGRFGVPVDRVSTFFKDRELQVTVNGSRRKVFHAVRKHTRKLQNGKQVDVKTHYRGARKFEWNGYNICITVPDHHHRSVEAFSSEMHDVGDVLRSDTANMMDTKNMASAIQQRIWR